MYLLIFHFPIGIKVIGKLVRYSIGGTSVAKVVARLMLGTALIRGRGGKNNNGSNTNVIT